MKKKPRIGLFSHDFYPIKGGQGRSFSEAFMRLCECPGEFEFFAFSPCRNSLPRHCSILSFTNRLPGAQILFSLLLNLWIGRIAAHHQLDAIVLNGGPGGILLLRPPPRPLAYWVNHTYAQQSAFLRGQAWKRIFIPLERFGYRAAERIAAISSTTAASLKEHYQLEEERISIIPIGVDTRRFKPLNLDREPHSLLYLGRLHSRKGIDFLMETMPAVCRRIPEARLYIAGTGELAESLSAFIRNHGLEDNVKLLGRVAEEELALWYNRCELQVMPSVFEGLGLTALEGMACGIALVATRVPGLLDIVEDGYNGALVAYGEREELCEKIVSLLKNEEARRGMAANGAATIREHYTWEKVTPLYQAFFRTWLSSCMGEG
jgi:glycosyltransferase involved in cell wall biosynthesis